jgi:chromate transporter
MSTFAGFKTTGYPGGVLATLALATPSLIIILIISGFLQKFQASKHVQNALYGLRPASIAMITAAGLNVAKVALVNIDAYLASRRITDLFLWKAILLGVIIFVGQKLFPKIHPIAFIAFSAVVGILFHFAGV